MKVRVEVEMLAMVVVLFLALGVSDGLVVDKCELGDELNSTLPANLLENITNLVAKIVCHVELSSRFNTSAINQVTGPNIQSFIHGGHGRRKGRSAESSSEESSEEDINSSNGAGRRRRSASESSSEESSEEDIDSSNGAGRRRRSAPGSSSEESSEENIKVPKHGFNSMVNPVTHPQGKNSSSGKVHRGYKGRSAESSSKESNERNMWTLYGLFQLPDRLACTSGFEPSLNFCSMACDDLIDDNISDDITCVETILNKMLSAGNSNGPAKALFSKLYAAFFQKECKNVKDFEYFSTC